VVIRQGDLGDVMYLVGNGRLEVRVYETASDSYSCSSSGSGDEEEDGQAGNKHSTKGEVQEVDEDREEEDEEDEEGSIKCAANPARAGGERPSSPATGCWWWWRPGGGEVASGGIKSSGGSFSSSAAGGAASHGFSSAAHFYAGGATPRHMSHQDLEELVHKSMAGAVAGGAAGRAGPPAPAAGCSSRLSPSQSPPPEATGPAGDGTPRATGATPPGSRRATRHRIAWHDVNRLAAGCYSRLGFLTQGQHFGQYSALLGEPRSASVVAVEFCELYALHRGDLEDLLGRYPELEGELVKMVGEGEELAAAVAAEAAEAAAEAEAGDGGGGEDGSLGALGVIIEGPQRPPAAASHRRNSSEVSLGGWQQRYRPPPSPQQQQQQPVAPGAMAGAQLRFSQDGDS
jgi:hypothetical protein